MANKREAKSRVAEWDDLRRQLGDIDDQLTALDKEEAEPKTGAHVRLAQRRKEQIQRDRDRLNLDRDDIKRKLDVMAETPPHPDTPYEESVKPSHPDAPYTDVDAEEQLPRQVIGGESSTAPADPGEKPPAGDVGGQYDINIGIGESGELIAPQGMTAEQVAIMVPGSFGAAPSDIKEAVSRPTTPAGDRPPADFKPTSYQDRERFEQNVMEEIGFNPILFNSYDHVNRAMKELPQLFAHVFGNTVMWADRNKLDKKQLAHWMSVVKMFRANKMGEAEEMKETGMAKYNWMMNKFDYTAKKKEAALKELRKAPTTRELWSDEKGAMTLHEWDPNQRRWNDTGEISAAPSAKQTPEQKAKETAYKRAWDIVKRFSSSFAQADLGDEPVDESDAVAKMNEIMALLGEGKIDERIRPMYEEALQTIRDYWGITEEVVEPTGPKPTIRYDKAGKRIQ